MIFFQETRRPDRQAGSRCGSGLSACNLRRFSAFLLSALTHSVCARVCTWKVSRGCSRDFRSPDVTVWENVQICGSLWRIQTFIFTSVRSPGASCVIDFQRSQEKNSNGIKPDWTRNWRKQKDDQIKKQLWGLELKAGVAVQTVGILVQILARTFLWGCFTF